MKPKMTEIRGVGASTLRLLEEQGLTSVTDVASAGVERLAAIQGFGPTRAKRVIDAATALLSEAASLIEDLPVEPELKDEGSEGDSKKIKSAKKKNENKKNNKIKKKEKKKLSQKKEDKKPKKSKKKNKKKKKK